jgi:hypothetical protein
MTDATNLLAAHSDVDFAAARASMRTLVLRRVAVIGFSCAADCQRASVRSIGSRNRADTINRHVRAADRQAMEDRQWDDCSRDGIDLFDANETTIVCRDRDRAVLDWRGNDVSLIR